MPKRDLILAEFCVRVFTSGKIDWDGVDQLVWRRLHQVPKDLRADNRAILVLGSRRPRRGKRARWPRRG
jgi:hypothetical protein